MTLTRWGSIVILIKLVFGVTLKRLDEQYAYCNDIDIREITISRIHRLYEQRKLSPAKLVGCYLDRIEALNPYLNAVIEVNPDATAIADEINMEFRTNRIIKLPLFGIPIMLKDNIATRDMMNTTAGSYALLNTRPKEDAEVVKLLRKAGAIILGKTNLSEFYGCRSSRIPPGWSSRGKQTKNPYNLREPTAGSSSGSAVAVAANLCTVALGTETDGSIILPSSLNSVVGLKPTISDIPMKGVIPASPSLDSVGPIARNIMDCFKLYKVISLGDHDENPDLITPFKENSYLQRIFSDKKYRVGVVDGTYFKDTVQTKMPYFNAAIDQLEYTGVTLVNDLTLDVAEITTHLESIVVAHEFKHNINHYLTNEVDYLDVIRHKIDSLGAIIKFNRDHPQYDPDHYGQDLLERADLVGSTYNETYAHAVRAIKRETQKKIQSLMQLHNLDALVIPSDEAIYPSDPASVAGYPILTIPVGHSEYGLPFGLSLFALPWSEETLFNLGSKIMNSNYWARAKPAYLE